jgi:hypothetical protein
MGVLSTIYTAVLEAGSDLPVCPLDQAQVDDAWRRCAGKGNLAAQIARIEDLPPSARADIIAGNCDVPALFTFLNRSDLTPEELVTIWESKPSAQVHRKIAEHSSLDGDALGRILVSGTTLRGGPSLLDRLPLLADVSDPELLDALVGHCDAMPHMWATLVTNPRLSRAAFLELVHQSGTSSWDQQACLRGLEVRDDRFELVDILWPKHDWRVAELISAVWGREPEQRAAGVAHLLSIDDDVTTAKLVDTGWMSGEQLAGIPCARITLPRNSAALLEWLWERFAGPDRERLLDRFDSLEGGFSGTLAQLADVCEATA